MALGSHRRTCECLSQPDRFVNLSCDTCRIRTHASQPPLEDGVVPSHLCPSPSRSEQLHALTALFVDSASEDDNMECVDDVVALRKLFVRLKKQRDHARSKRNAAATYTLLARQAIRHIQAKLNAGQKGPKSRRNINTGGRIVTGEEGRALAAQQRQARIEKQSNTEQTRQKKNHAEFERHVRRYEKGRDGMTFTGALNTQKRSNLADIAWCMDIDDSGTRNTLITRISAHVIANEQLREDARFSGLWRRSINRAAPDGSRDTKQQRIEDGSNSHM